MALQASSLARNAGGFVNTLTAQVSVTATTLPVSNASLLASINGGKYVIRIDGEQLLITSVDTGQNTITVVRGYDGTTATAHSLGAWVEWAYDQIGQQRDTTPDIGAYEYLTLSSTVNPLPPVETSASFLVTWSGHAPASGPAIANYTVYVSDNGGPFTAWLTKTTSTAATFTGVSGHTYGFYSVATDAMGDVQSTPDAAQATTAVNLSGPPVVAIGGGSVTYTSGGSAIAVAPAATLTAGDTLFANATLTVTNTNGGGSDLLGIRSSGSLTISSATISYGGTTVGSFIGGAATTPLTVSFNASATQAAVLAVIQNVTYSNISLSPSLFNRNVTIQLADGANNRDALVTQTVALTTPPVLASSNSSITYTSGGSPAVGHRRLGDALDRECKICRCRTDRLQSARRRQRSARCSGGIEFYDIRHNDQL